MSPDDRSPTAGTDHDEMGQGVASAPVAQSRREGSFGDVNDTRHDTSPEASFGEVDRTPGTEGDVPTEGMVDTSASGAAGSYGDFDRAGPDTTRPGSYGEVDRTADVDLDRPEGIDKR